MPLSKQNLNIIFAIVVLGLAATAIVSKVRLFKNSAVAKSSPDRLPQDHPSMEMINKLSELESLSAKNPSNLEYKTHIGDIYYDMGKYEKAAEYYQASLKLKPKNPNVETDLAVCFHYLGQNDQSLQALDNVLEYSPDFAEALFNKGIVIMRAKGDLKSGLAVWERLLKAHPDYPKKAEIKQAIDQMKSSAR
jgi:tetratricopeptide (TPR) repeat protein